MVMRSTSARVRTFERVDVAAEVAPAPTRYMPRSLHSVGNVENLTLTGAAAIDGIGNAKATVINGTGNILSEFAPLTR
jgi:hypothetical protein